MEDLGINKCLRYKIKIIKATIPSYRMYLKGKTKITIKIFNNQFYFNAFSNY